MGAEIQAAAEQTATTLTNGMPTITNQLATELLNWLDGTKDFVLTQAPELAQQIVRWGIASASLDLASSLFWMGLGVMLLCLARRNWLHYKPACKEYWQKSHTSCDEDTFETGRIALVALPAFIGGCIFLGFLNEANKDVLLILKATLTPKLYLLEYLRNMVK